MVLSFKPSKVIILIIKWNIPSCYHKFKGISLNYDLVMGEKDLLNNFLKGFERDPSPQETEGALTW